ncbi:energy transducer TonB [Phenylobacterium sp. J367]|uniref:energy transducer TonB n=1 Tax=Phenylobacterium sp. J367 TaxID=2898435 RepID=UPI00215166BB|nr:energy transducer TonB [Phenylobacterium sp. J367]MCR5878856.1 energy transducer TonB [Phenylobacterium sp. J367]
MTLKLTAALAVLAAAAATSASAQVAVAGWSKVPTAAEIAAAYPPRAKAAGVGGMVLLSCTLTRALQPRDCTATHEEPANLGFGTAARKIAEAYLVAAPQEKLVKGSEVEIPSPSPWSCSAAARSRSSTRHGSRSRRPPTSRRRCRRPRTA